MKKNVIILLVLLVVLGIGVAALLLLNREEPDSGGEDVSAEETTYVLGGIPQPEVKNVEIANKEDTYVIQSSGEKGEEVYSIEGLDTDTLNQSMLKSVFTAAGSLPVKTVIAESGADLETYGLGSPRATLTVTYADQIVKIGVGDETPGNEGTYVLKDDTVYLVDTSKLTNVFGSRLSFANKTVTLGNPTTSVIDRMNLSGTAYQDPISIQNGGDSEVTTYTGMSSYLITAPIEIGLDTNKIEVLQGIYGLVATETVANLRFDDPAAAEFGLDEPYCSVDVSTQPQAEEEGGGVYPDFSLVVSTPDEEGFVYVQSTLQNYVYRMPAASISFLGLDLFDLQEKMIILPHIDSVAEVEVRTADGVHTFALSGEGDELQVIGDGNELDASNFRQFYQTLIAARYDERIPREEGGTAAPADAAVTALTDVSEEPSSEEPSEEETAESASSASAEESEESAEEIPDESTATAETPETEGDFLLQYTYRYREGGEDVVTFQKGPARKVIVRLNNGTAYYAQSIYTDQVLEDLPKVLAGEEVDSYL